MDVILRGAKVVDGTGAPGRAGDVVIEAGRIAAVGEIPQSVVRQARVVDLDGLVLAPGFVDVHTHFDAQVLWDPALTPSCWHGITTVVMGNCGFGIAPTRPEHRNTIARTLENVEGMSVEALEAGIPWTFQTFPEYLATLDRSPMRLNVGAMIGHTPLRLYVLGDEATERVATGVEVGRMRDLVVEALLAGAVGFATSKASTHTGADGKPVPSRLANLDEVGGIAEALRTTGRGVIQVAVGPGLFVQECAVLSERTGRPVTWTALLTGMKDRPALETLERQASLGGEVWPQMACRPIVMQVDLSDPFPFAPAPAFKEILALPREERAQLYADPSWRERARGDVGDKFGKLWDRTTVQETEGHPELKNGPTIAQLAAVRGVHPLDVMLDLASEAPTRFRMVLLNDDEEEIGRLLRDERTLLALSDAGAHASQLCDACFSTYLLEHWVRETGVLSLEQAVWRLTGHPSHVFRLEGRGRLAPGFAADLVAFDPDTVGVEELERVWDLPAGADRLIARSRGIEAVWVNGTPIRLHGEDLAGAHPGVLIGGDRR
jgi:N-acyl-D-amino-acid deacylase